MTLVPRRIDQNVFECKASEWCLYGYEEIISMWIDTLLENFEPANNIEYKGKRFLTHVPWVAPKAYLNIIFPPAKSEVQNKLIDPLQLPREVRSFYRQCNGASLFSGSIHILGFVSRDSLIDRSNWKGLPPHDLIGVNEEFFDDIYCNANAIVGSYAPDASRVVVQKTNGEVYCSIGSDLSGVRATWGSFESWIESEVKRVSQFFDRRGRRLVDDDLLLPG